MWYRWQKENITEKRLKVTKLNWKAIEDQQLISESTFDYMKKWVDENKKPTDLIMTSTKMLRIHY
jgi:hypothetical protein